MIKSHDWFFVHNAGSNWAPLCVRPTDAFASNHSEVQLLRLAQLHNSNRHGLSCLWVDETYWLHRAIRALSGYVCRSNFVQVQIFVNNKKSQIDGALFAASTTTLALSMKVVIVNVQTDKRYEPASMS